MKVLHVIPSYEPAWAFGGTVTATSYLCRALAQKGIDVTVYTTDADGKGGYLDVPLNEPVDLGGVKVWYFHCDFGVKKAFYSRGLSKKLKESLEDFDLIHTSAVWQFIQLAVSKVCKYYRVPYIVSAHGSFKEWPWQQNKIRKRIYWYLFGKRTMNDVAAVHFATELERKASISTVPLLSNIPSYVVPNGIPFNEKGRVQNKRQFLNIYPKEFIILFLGRIHKAKGIDFVLKALSLIENENFRFLIVGPEEDKAYSNYLKKLSNKLEIKEKIIWYGPVHKAETGSFYSSSSLMVLTSNSENFGMVIIEAMSYGLPVLISKNTGIWQDVVANNAGVAVDLNENSIAKEIEKLVVKPSLLSEMSKNASFLAKNKYNIDNIASLMIKAYEDVLTNRRSKGLKWQ